MTQPKHTVEWLPLIGVALGIIAGGIYIWKYWQ